MFLYRAYVSSSVISEPDLENLYATNHMLSNEINSSYLFIVCPNLNNLVMSDPSTYDFMSVPVHNVDTVVFAFERQIDVG